MTTNRNEVENMAVKVKDIYYKVQQQIGSDITLLAGRDGLGEIVKGFHMVEAVDITHFVQEGEFIVSIGIALESLDDLIEIVCLSRAKNACAILLNIGPYIKEVPDEVITFCNQNSFALFVCPWKVQMTLIIKTVADAIAHEDRRRSELISAFKNALCLPREQELYIPYLSRYDYEIDRQYCIAVIEVEKRDQELTKDELRHLQHSVDNVLNFNDPKSLSFHLRGDIIICIPGRHKKSIHQIIYHVIETLSVKYENMYQLYIGIGRNTKSARCLYKTYSIALKVADLQKKRGNAWQVLSYGDMDFSRLFLSLGDRDIATDYYHETLAPLIEYDAMNNTDFVSFLRIYFEHDCNVKETAEAMYVHRNTINYKITKIEDIIGYSLSSFKKKAELLLALGMEDLL
jgi:sugar diacid utilization regulator